MTSGRFVIRSVLKAGVVVLLAVGFDVPDDASATGQCGITRAIVVRASSHALVVRRGHKRRRYWACLRSIGRPVRVGPTTGEIPAGDETFVPESLFSFGGRFFAEVNYSCLEGCGSEQVEIYDLRSRRRVRTIDTEHELAKVRLGTRGAVALVEDDTVQDIPGSRRRIVVVDSRGRTEVTEGRRRQIPAASVRVDGNLLRWTQAGIEHAFRMH